MTPQDLLTSIGLNIASNAIYEFITTFFAGKTNPTQKEFKAALKAFLSIENADIYSDKIIDFLAANGDIIITGSSIFSGESITYKSSSATNFQIKNNTDSKTNYTSIEIGAGASIKGAGGASITQTDQGITFST